MYEKLVTFEEEKRKEHLYLLFNSFFICACLICVLEVVFKAPFLLTDDISNDGVRWFIETLIRPWCSAMAVFIPFFIYNVRQETPFKNKLRPAINKAEPVYYILGIVSVAAAVPFFVYLGELFSNFMISKGYVIHEIYPEVGDGIAANIFYALYTAAVTSVFLELSFRGVVAEKLVKAHMALVLIVPALISSLYTHSFIKMPYLFVTSLIISWCYVKTKSLYLSMALNFTASVAFSAVCVLKLNYEGFYSANIQSVAVICALICFGAFALLAVLKGIKLQYPEPKDADEAYERLTGKEAFFGLIKSFAFWIVIFMLMFQLLFSYLDKPMRIDSESDMESGYVTQTE